jgi:hypothetical protein
MGLVRLRKCHSRQLSKGVMLTLGGRDLAPARDATTFQGNAGTHELSNEVRVRQYVRFLALPISQEAWRQLEYTHVLAGTTS